MKALALDISSPHISFTAKNGDSVASLCINSSRQSEILLSCMQTVLEQVGLCSQDLEFTALAGGPGSFTGLRLAFSALKGIELAYGCPIYAVPTMTAYAHAFKNWNGALISVLDAKKERFYASIFRNGKEVAGPFDKTCAEILYYVDEEERVLLAGDGELFSEAVKNVRPNQNVVFFETAQPFSAQVLKLACEYRQNGIKPVQEYEGPIYIRKSEAEEKFCDTANEEKK